MGTYQINKIPKINQKIKTVINKTIKIFKVKMLFSKCNNSLLFREGKISLRGKDFLTIKLTIQWIFKIKLTHLKLTKTHKTLKEIQVVQVRQHKKMLICLIFKIYKIKD
jgi:hypothetical protein